MPTPPYLQSCPAPDKPPQRLRWTAERVALLRDNADKGSVAVAATLGVSSLAVRQKASSLGISLTQPARVKRPIAEGDDALRERWSRRIGPMKESLRAELAGQ